MEECLEELHSLELDAGHCAVWRLPVGTTLFHFVRDKEVVFFFQGVRLQPNVCGKVCGSWR